MLENYIVSNVTLQYYHNCGTTYNLHGNVKERHNHIATNYTIFLLEIEAPQKETINNFKNTFSHRTPLVDASEKSRREERLEKM